MIAPEPYLHTINRDSHNICTIRIKANVYLNLRLASAVTVQYMYHVYMYILGA